MLFAAGLRQRLKSETDAYYNNRKEDKSQEALQAVRDRGQGMPEGHYNAQFAMRNAQSRVRLAEAERISPPSR